jgi:hypothetical protein
LFGDYKLSFFSNDATSTAAERSRPTFWTNHFILGVSYRFGGSRALDDGFSK